MKRLPFLLIAPLMIAAAPLVAPQAYVRDPAHSQINFTAESMLLSAQGTFDRWDAQIMFDAEQVEATSLKISIDAKSINTRLEMRDNHLRSNDFLATDSFPTITFVSTGVNKTAANRMLVTGDLTIRGRTKRVAIPVRLNFFDPARNIGRVSGTFVVDRTEFGVSFSPPTNPVEPEVAVQFDVTFQKPRA